MRKLIAPPISEGTWALHEKAAACVTLKDRVIANCSSYANNHNSEQIDKENGANATYIAACKGAYGYLEKEWNRMNEAHTELVDAGIVGSWHPHKALEELETILLSAGYKIETT